MSKIIKNGTAGSDLATCSVCKKPTEWVRCTQFSGEHPFCNVHARKERDFGENNASYFCWKPWADYLELTERMEKRKAATQAAYDAKMADLLAQRDKICTDYKLTIDQVRDIHGRMDRIIRIRKGAL